MDNNAKKKFRWRYFIDKPFQIRFIGRFVILILLGLGISMIVIGIVNINRYKDNLYYKTLKLDPSVQITETDPDKNFANSIDRTHPLNIFQLYFPPLIIISALYLILIAIFGLFISHKMAGPIYRIRKTLQDATDGKLDMDTIKFRLRKGDELQDLVTSMNNFLEKYGKKIVSK